MAYGTPSHPDQIEAYYTDIRRGRPPTPEALADLTRPLRGDRGRLAARRPDRRATRRDPGRPRRARTGDVRRRARDEAHRSEGRRRRASGGRGRRRAGGRAWCSPRTSPRISVGDYLARCRAGASTRPRRHRPPVELRGIESWATEPALVAFLAGDLGPRLDAMRATTGHDVRVLFTAHSLPQRIIDERRPVPRRAPGRRRRPSPNASVCATGRSPGNRRDGPPSRGSGPTSCR